jgi:precorrin-2/cobalt-factor-2 C20-methyltransferase
MTRGVLYGVSVGPGDPELLTLRAVRAIVEADVVAVPDAGNGPGTAFGIAKQYLAGKTLVRCPVPMTRDQSVLDAAHRSVADQLRALLDDGLSVAYLCLGDISIYSSYHYLDRLVRERGYETRIIPGVTSFCAAAARLGMPLCLGSERLVVSPAEPGLLDETLDMPATKVLMKAGKSFPILRDRLAERGELGQASLVSACGMLEERVYDHIEDAPDDVGYLSLAIVRGEQEEGQSRD